MMNKIRSYLITRISISSNHFNSGQAIILIALASMGLIAIMGLAVDGGRLFYLNRRTQNATDAAVLAAAKSMCSGQTVSQFQSAGYTAASLNGFNNSASSAVAINVPPTTASINISAECTGCYVEAMVTGKIPGTFISMFYKGQLASTGKAIAACNPNKSGDEANAYGQRAIFAIAPKGSCTPAEVKINASALTINGGIHDNGNLQIEGGGNNDNIITGPVSHIGEVKTNEDKFTFISDGQDIPGPDGTTTGGNCRASCFQSPSSIDPNACKTEFYPTTNPFQVCQPKPDPLAGVIKISDYAYTPGSPATLGPVAAAEYNTGHYFYYVSNQCNGQHSFATWMVNQGHMVGNTIVHPGLYYTTCDISLTGAVGTATFVTTGNISISGGFNLTAYLSNKLLFYTTTGQKPNATGTCNGNAGINLSGSGNTYTGDIYAPYSAVSFSAADNMTANGCVTAWQVDFQGSHSTLNCVRSDPNWTPEPVIWLPEY